MFQDNGPIDGVEPVLVGTHTEADKKANADTEMVDNPSGLPLTSTQVCVQLIVTCCFSICVRI